jgi:hypothetical protein
MALGFRADFSDLRSTPPKPPSEACAQASPACARTWPLRGLGRSRPWACARNGSRTRTGTKRAVAARRPALTEHSARLGRYGLPERASGRRAALRRWPTAGRWSIAPRALEAAPFRARSTAIASGHEARVGLGPRARPRQAASRQHRPAGLADTTRGCRVRPPTRAPDRQRARRTGGAGWQRLPLRREAPVPAYRVQKRPNPPATRPRPPAVGQLRPFVPITGHGRSPAALYRPRAAGWTP